MEIYPKNLLLLGSGELGKEIIIAAKRLGCNTIACDRYPNAPGMQVADKSEVFDITDPNKLKTIIQKHNPDLIIPEIEALAVNTLLEIEKEGIQVIPNARATSITMNRDKIRDLAKNNLNLKTAKYAYAENTIELEKAIEEIGLPVIVKPVMSSSGKGQSLINNISEAEEALKFALTEARGKSNKIIVEEFIKFDLEITLLTIRQKDGCTIFCSPIGHTQKKGDYQNSWQPADLTIEQLDEAKNMAKTITDNLGGTGLFGVEFFIANGNVIFSELSPRPHDTGLVTLISQNLNEFELHLRAILGIPIPEINIKQPAASQVILSKEKINQVEYQGIEEALSIKNSQIYIFGKPNARRGRRMGVALATDTNTDEALKKAIKVAQCIEVKEKLI